MARAANGFLVWKQTRQGQVISGLIELGLAYGFGSWAIDSGSWWHYVLAFVFLIGGIQNLVRAGLKHG